MKTSRATSGLLALATAATFAPAATHAAGAADNAKASTRDTGVKPTAKNQHGLSAPTIEQLAGRFGAAKVRQVRAELLAGMNKDAAEQYGPISPARAQALGRSNYYADQDMAVYVVKSGGDEGFLGVPLHVHVGVDGSVALPEAPQNAAGDPTFGGPWGTQDVYNLAFTGSNDGGFECNTTTATNHTRVIAKKLNDASGSKDYYGIGMTAAVEVDHKSGNCANDFIDKFIVGMSSDTGGARYVDQDPIVDYSGNCRDTTLTVGGGFGGVNASISKTISKCEYWDVVNGNVGPASNHYNIQYDNKGACVSSRSASELAVIEVPQGAARGLIAYYGVNPGNNNQGGCSGTCNGS